MPPGKGGLWAHVFACYGHLSGGQCALFIEFIRAVTDHPYDVVCFGMSVMDDDVLRKNINALLVDVLEQWFWSNGFEMYVNGLPRARYLRLDTSLRPRNDVSGGYLLTEKPRHRKTVIARAMSMLTAIAI
ncbi:MAG: hypothetical protein FWE34_04955 [Defluviitaleaceae bacterium]|nr:hypothetical protein [Defluviitaleaceae bacterium]